MRVRRIDLLTFLALLFCLATVIPIATSFWHPIQHEYTSGDERRRLVIINGTIWLDNEPQIQYERFIDPGTTRRWAWGLSSGVPLIFAGGALVIVLFSQRRRARQSNWLKQGLCPTCGYDMRATPHRCPECGTQIPASETSPSSRSVQ